MKLIDEIHHINGQKYYCSTPWFFKAFFLLNKGALKTVIFRATLLKGNDSLHSQLVREQVMGLEITANLCALS